MPWYPFSKRVLVTSRYSGSPEAPGSLVRSRTAINLTLFGRDLRKAVVSNGRYRRTRTTPTFSPFSTRFLTVASAVSPPDAIMMITRSASGGETAEATVRNLVEKGEKVGVV